MMRLMVWMFGFLLCQGAEKISADIHGILFAQDDPKPGVIERLILNFENDSPEVREKAVMEVSKIGKPAVPLLEVARQNKTLQVNICAQQALDKIEWGPGFEAVRKYAGEYLEEGVTIEYSRMRALITWFPSSRFIEVRSLDQGRRAAMGNRMPARGLFEIRKYEPVFHTIESGGIFNHDALIQVITSYNIKLDEWESVMSFVQVFMELYTLSTGQAIYISSLSYSYEKGWVLTDRNSLTSYTFMRDNNHILTDVVVNVQGRLDNTSLIEKQKLDLEKLKLEIEALKAANKGTSHK